MVPNKIIRVEVAYAAPTQQHLVTIEVLEGATIKQAIEQSGLLTRYPEIDLTQQKVGVFSQLKNLTDSVFEGDRIEIYRPLTIDPKEARRLRAMKKKK